MVKKLRIFEVFLVMAIFFICLFSLGLKSFLYKNELNLNVLKNSIENEWKENIHDDLIYVQENLEKSINDNTICSSDDGAITKIVLEHLSLKNKDYIKNFTIINIGYSLNDYGELSMNLYMKEDDEFNKESLDDINDQFKSINNINNISSEELENHINEISYNISEKYNIDYNNVKKLINESLFEKNKVLFSTSENDISEKNDESIWIETISIPDGNLGFMNEPEIKNNEPNMFYKKILVIASVDSEKIMKPFNDHCKDMRYLIYMIYISFTLVMILYMIITFSYFIKIINSVDGEKESIGGDTNANVFKSIRSIFSGKLRINGNGTRKNR